MRARRSRLLDGRHNVPTCLLCLACHLEDSHSRSVEQTTKHRIHTGIHFHSDLHRDCCCNLSRQESRCANDVLLAGGRVCNLDYHIHRNDHVSPCHFRQAHCR